jgi:hypothetical protein
MIIRVLQFVHEDIPNEYVRIRPTRKFFATYFKTLQFK